MGPSGAGKTTFMNVIAGYRCALHAHANFTFTRFSLFVCFHSLQFLLSLRFTSLFSMYSRTDAWASLFSQMFKETKHLFPILFWVRVNTKIFAKFICSELPLPVAQIAHTFFLIMSAESRMQRRRLVDWSLVGSSRNASRSLASINLVACHLMWRLRLTSFQMSCLIFALRFGSALSTDLRFLRPQPQVCFLRVSCSTLSGCAKSPLALFD